MDNVRSDASLRKSYIVPKTIHSKRFIPQSQDKRDWSIPAMKNVVSQKIEQRVIVSMDVKQQVYTMFQRPRCVWKCTNSYRHSARMVHIFKLPKCTRM